MNDAALPCNPQPLMMGLNERSGTTRLCATYDDEANELEQDELDQPNGSLADLPTIASLALYQGTLGTSVWQGATRTLTMLPDTYVRAHSSASSTAGTVQGTETGTTTSNGSTDAHSSAFHASVHERDTINMCKCYRLSPRKALTDHLYEQFWSSTNQALCSSVLRSLMSTPR